jgi:hypothetical protein
MTKTTLSPVAQQLLDAQVAWLVEQLTGPALADQLAADLDELLSSGSRLTLGQLVSADSIKPIARSLFTVVPPSAGAAAVADMAAGVVYAGPGHPFAVSDVLDKENLERLVDFGLERRAMLGEALDELANSPLLAAMISRGVTKVIADALAANKAVAEKIPGVGSLVSFGTKTAGKAVGAAAGAAEGFMGDAASKGAAFAMRRVNKIVIDSLGDPGARAAALEIFDMYAHQSIPTPENFISEDEVRELAAILHDIIVAGSPTEPVLALVDALIDGFFNVYGEHPVTVLLDELDLPRDTVLAYAAGVVPQILSGAHESGELERLARVRLAPFFSTPAVAQILG